jgi:ElaB/YqjD/DUF883 family membrane-anchored ribosome-binding protein
VVDKIFGYFVGGVVGEMKDHPWTMLVLAGCIGLLTFNTYHHANADDLTGIRSEVAMVASAVNDIRAAQIEDKILAARSRFCKALKDGDVQQKHYFGELTSEYQEQYRKVTGRVYLTPSCDEV